MHTWLLLDVNNLAYRAFHSQGHLTYGAIRTGVIYGVLRDIIHLQDLFNTNRIAFCFDKGRSFRYTDYPGYKSSRWEKLNEEEKEQKLELRDQIKLIRRDYLPSLGYQNIFSQKGYEADDIIASLCSTLPQGDDAIIVSSDKDLYQLLSPRVSVFSAHSQKTTTYDSFVAKYGIEPGAWADAKAIAGCKTDDIEGVPGVAEITAAKFLSGKLKPSSTKWEAITKNNDLWRRNLPLVRLPYPEVKTFTLQKDYVSPERWKELTRRLGMRTLEEIVPRVNQRKAIKKKKKGFGLI